MTVYEKLQESRVELQKLNIKKSGKNKYSGFSYYELSDFLPHINNIFKELKLCAVFNIEEDMATLLVINSEKSEETISFRSPIKEIELKGCSGIQGIGAQHTYMRRYLYINALEIVENDMLDAKAGDICGDMSIAGIKSVEELNEIYRGLLEKGGVISEKNKLEIKEASERMGAKFNVSARRFECQG
jgi:hypothetical protein